MSDLKDRLQATLGNNYTLERELGGGGMSPEEMSAELETAVTPSATTPHIGFTPARPRSVWPGRMLIGGGVAALVVIGFFGFRSYNETRNLDSNRVIVGPFQNRTGDPGLDNLSTMATDWIARGLNETAIADIVSFSPARDAAGKIAPSEFEAAGLARRACSTERIMGRQETECRHSRTRIGLTAFLIFCQVSNREIIARVVRHR